MQSTVKTRAVAAFKKEQRQIDATAAWNEHLARQSAVVENTARLRQLRLLRDRQIVPVAPVQKATVKKKKKAA